MKKRKQNHPVDHLAVAAQEVGLSETQLDAVRGWLLEQFASNLHARLAEAGHSGKKPSLQTVFVDLPFSGMPGEKIEGSFLQQFMAASPVPVASILQEHEAFLGEEAVDLSGEKVRRASGGKRAVAQPFGAVLLIGGPGQGKSTLGQLACQMHRVALLQPWESGLALHISEEFAAFSSLAAFGLALPTAPALPLQINLPLFATWARESADIDSPWCLLAFLMAQASAKASGLTLPTLLALLPRLPIVLNLDGFDEVGAGPDRARIVAVVRAFVGALAQMGARLQVLAATRPQGYNEELAGCGLAFQRRELTALPVESANHVARRLITVVFAGVDRQTDAEQRFKKAIADATTRRLLQTPLNIIIFTLLLEQLGRVPRERWRLFQVYFDITFNREVSRGSFASNLLRDHRREIEQIHQQVALFLQIETERNDGAALLSRGKLLETVCGILKDDGLPASARTELAGDLVRAAEERLVFLVEGQPNLFGFEVRSLQEFWAAAALLNGRDSEVEDRLHAIACIPVYANVLLFMLSKFFSEGGHWRDYLVKKFIPALNDLGSVERLLLPGSHLALTALEEGMVVGQPGRAKELFECACAILTLPFNNNQSADKKILIRLLNAEPSEVPGLLRSCVEKTLRSAHPLNLAWVILFLMKGESITWVDEVRKKYQYQILDWRVWFSYLNEFALQCDDWIRQKILNHADELDLVNFDAFEFSNSKLNATWVDWLIGVSHSLEKRVRYRNGLVDLYTDDLLRQLRALPPNTPVPQNWGVEAELIALTLAPSAENLASYLKNDFYNITRGRKRILYALCPWPLKIVWGFLGDEKAGAAAVIQALTDGKMGDTDDWRCAQQSNENKSWRRSLNYFQIGVPWNLEVLRDGLPPFWQNWHGIVADVIEQHEEREFLKEVIKTAKDDLPKNSLKTLYLLYCIVFVKLSDADDEMISFLKTAVATVPDTLGFLMPRPRSLPEPEWFAILEATPPISSIFSVSQESILGEEKLHLQTMRVQLLSLHLVGNFNQVGWAHSLNQFAEKKIPEWLLLAAWAGILPVDKDGELVDMVNQCVWSAEQPKRYQGLLITVIDDSALPIARQLNILANLYLTLDDGDYQGRQRCIKVLRKISQRRESGLIGSAAAKLNLPLAVLAREGTDVGNWLEVSVCVSTLTLTEIRSFESFTLTFAPPAPASGQWIVFLGQNGVGKTTLLRSIALALRNVDDPTIWPEKTFNDWPRIRANGRLAPASKIALQLTDGTRHEVIIRTNGSTTKEAVRPHKHLTHGLVFAYGCRRGSALGNEMRQYTFDIKKNGPEIATLFDEHKGMVHAETWLKELYREQKPVYAAVCRAMCTFLDLDAFEWADNQIHVTEKGKPRLPLDQLSDGYLTGAGWVIDLFARWLAYAASQGIEITPDFASQMKGVVLIDEIDLHLHPRWQIDIIRRTRKLMPAMSFIVTTHNPLTLVGAKAEEIWILENQEGKITARQGDRAPMLLSGGEIYTDYFGLEDIYPDGLGQALEDYRFLSRFAMRSDEQDAELKRLTERLRAENLLPAWPVVARRRPAATPAVPLAAPAKRASRSKKQSAA